MSKVFKELYVGNLAPGTVREDLEAAFAAWDGRNPTLAVVEDRMADGYGFITVEAKQVAHAIAALHGSMIHGRSVTVCQALWRGAPEQADPQRSTVEPPWATFEAARRQFDAQRVDSRAGGSTGLLQGMAGPSKAALGAPGNALPQRWRIPLPFSDATSAVEVAADVVAEVVAAPHTLARRWRAFWRR